ncbi:Fc receptor-like protein 5 [Marmota marmota marmota]|uniref:Fc receptor-like protein 5 n=1 Tax=Marmota marmota marmota TaxID=9994 RepID=UPI002093E4D5|nr:Fc receptor-like protein 5 [Marmota marmota marmota]
MRKLVFGSQVLVVPVFMLLWVTLLVLAPVSEQLVTPSKSIISLQFPWTVFFQGESMDLTCKGSSSHSPRTTKWYFEGKVLEKTPKSTLRVRESGDYKCQADGLPVSDPVHLEFSTAPLILQGPPYVFEGDSMLLRCRTKAKTELNTVVFFKNGERLMLPNNSSDLHIDDADLAHNGHYHCGGYIHRCCAASSNRVSIQIRVLFPRPVLRSSSSKPTEGSPVTLTCQTQLPPERSDVQLQFCFFRDSQALGSGWRSSPKLRIPALGTEDSGSYWCQAKRVNSHLLKESWKISITVWGVTVKVQIRTVPALGPVFEGQKLTLICSVDRLPGLITFSWYKVNLGKETKIHTFSEAEFKISMVKGSDAGDYYSAVSQPVLTLNPAKNWLLEGTWLTLHCEVQRGSPPILYKFYHDSVSLGSSSTPSTGRASLGISLTAQHSGFYYCTADNGFSPQRSEAVRLSVLVPLSRPVLTRRAPMSEPVVGDVMELHCEALSGSLPITYTFYHDDITLGRRVAYSRGGVSFRLSVTAEHSGNYFCKASNSAQTQHSDTMTLTVISLSRPVLTLRDPSVQPVVGDVMELHCEALSGSLPITYTFYHEDVNLGSRKAHSRGGAYLSLTVTAEHSGNYFCEASNSAQTQRSDTMTLTVKIPVSRPVLTLRDPSVQPVVGDVMELHCEALSGSLPITYTFYHEDVNLGSIKAHSRGEAYLSVSVTAEHSGKYFCEASNSAQTQRSDTMTLTVKNVFSVEEYIQSERLMAVFPPPVSLSRPVLTLRDPSVQPVVGDVMELHCEALSGSLPITYTFYHEDVNLGSRKAHSRGGAYLSLTVTAEHSGNYFCEASNSAQTQRSDTMTLTVKIPVSRPVLTLRDPSIQPVVGDVMELHCEALSGSPPILYKFYHEDVTLGSTMAPSGGGASFNLSLMEKHSGNYSCEAENDLEIQHSELVTVIVTVPVSRPVLTLRAPRAQAEVGDVVELHCEALRGSPPILYQFYHEDVTLGNSSAPSGGGASFNLSLTAERSGNYSCEADNGQGAQRSEAVALFIPGLTESRSGPVAPGVTGGLLGMVVLAAGALLFYHWLSRKAGGRTASDPSRHSSDSNPQDPTYHNVPGWIELQPVYMNVNSRGEDVVYSEVSCLQKESRNSAASAHSLSHQTDSSVIYAKVKKACTPASGPHQLASPAPHR